MQIIKKTKQLNNINVHLIETQKFKTVHIVVKFKAPLQRETITKRALLPYILRKGTETYPSEVDIQMKLNQLYGASLSIDGSKKGDNHIITFRLEVANDKFIKNETTLFADALQLLREIIYAPKTVDNSFDPQIFTREKLTLRQEIESVIDDKVRYANMRLIDEMYADERYSLHVHGYLDDLEKLTPEQLYEYYISLLVEDEMDIYVLGDFNEEEIKNKLTTNFTRINSINSSENSRENQLDKTKEPNTIIETQDIQQAKLHIGYKTNTTFGDDDYYALQLFNGLFGGFPSSKLFLNVREKHSLAYYAASRIESHKGILLVFSGIDSKDYEQAKEIIDEQLEAMKQGKFTEEDLIETKEQITNQILETLDNPNGIIEMFYQQVISNAVVPPHNLIQKINEATKEDVVDVAQKVELDTVYLLTSKVGEANA